jgi:hypothetical protein
MHEHGKRPLDRSTEIGDRRQLARLAALGTPAARPNILVFFRMASFSLELGPSRTTLESMENRDRFDREEIDQAFEVVRCPNCGFAPALHFGSSTRSHDEFQATFNPRDANAKCPICESSFHPPARTFRSSEAPASGVDLAWEGWLEQRRVEHWLWFTFAAGLSIAVILFLWRF